ncbi:hypothetical protein [Hyphomicrobium sp.]|uniref:hypothetical protein n=1 Tax=Hyphomicrobium sp. TaxID=82 RepID=UPI002FE15BD4
MREMLLEQNGRRYIAERGHALNDLFGPAQQFHEYNLAAIRPFDNLDLKIVFGNPEIFWVSTHSFRIP